MEENHSIGIDKLVQQDLILHKHPCDIRTFFEVYCKSRQIDYTIKMNLQTNESIVHFVSNGLGASFLPRMMTKNINNPAIKICKIDEDGFGRSVDLLYKPSLKKIARKIRGCVEEITGANGDRII